MWQMAREKNQDREVTERASATFKLQEAAEGKTGGGAGGQCTCANSCGKSALLAERTAACSGFQRRCQLRKCYMHKGHLQQQKMAIVVLGERIKSQ